MPFLRFHEIQSEMPSCRGNSNGLGIVRVHFLVGRKGPRRDLHFPPRYKLLPTSPVSGNQRNVIQLWEVVESKELGSS